MDVLESNGFFLGAEVSGEVFAIVEVDSEFHSCYLLLLRCLLISVCIIAHELSFVNTFFRIFSFIFSTAVLLIFLSTDQGVSKSGCPRVENGNQKKKGLAVS